MKAVIINQPGSPNVLQIQDVLKPHINDSQEILIRLRAAGVNPIDTKVRQRGTFYPQEMPAILGCDGAGVVETVGSGVDKFRPGDEVYFCYGGLGKRSTGNYAQYAVVDQNFVAAKPKSLSFAEAAAAPLVLITAWEALYDRGGLEPGRRVLIHGGAGGVGHVAVQLAKLKGAEVATTVGSVEKERFVRSLGADYPILYQQRDFVQATLDWTGEEGVELALDTVGGATFAQTFAAIQLYGDIVTLLQPDGKTNWKPARSRNLRIGFELMLTPQLNNNFEAIQAQGQILKQCSRLFDQGRLKIHVNQTFPLEKVAKAHEAIEGGSTLGKLVLIIF